jgi:hypothetical protein
MIKNNFLEIITDEFNDDFRMSFGGEHPNATIVLSNVLESHRFDWIGDSIGARKPPQLTYSGGEWPRVGP